jgi:hypothetical protein
MNSNENQTRTEIVDGVIRLLRDHKNKLAGSIHQDPYKSDFFKLFADAYNAGLMQQYRLRADALADSVAERDPDVTGDELFVTLITFWREWTYAWERHDQLHAE